MNPTVETVPKNRFMKSAGGFNRIVAIVVCVLFVIVGVVVMRSRAATPSIAVEPEQASLDSDTRLLADTSASSGGAIQFRPGPTRGSYVIYSSAQNNATAQIWRMKLDGSENRQLTNDPEHEYQWARPSPDGNSILYTRANKGESVNLSAGSNTLWVMNADGTNPREIISIDKRNSYGWTGLAHAEWSPDSKRIVLAAPMTTFTTQLFIVDSAGNNPKQITDRTVVDGQQTNALDPSWGPNDTIMFVRSWNCLFICGSQDVFRLDLATKQEQRITSDKGVNWDPYLSPDGSTYVWLYFRDNPATCPCDLYAGNSVGDLNPRPVIADGGANANGTFSTDSKSLLFLKQVYENNTMKQKIHSINVDGTGLKPVGITAVGETGIASFWP